jgi:hypothetical protein
MAQKAFESITLGHMRSHGCRDLLVYCAFINCNNSTIMNADYFPERFAYSLTRSPGWCAGAVGIGEPMCGPIGGRIRISGTLEKGRRG